MSLFNNNTCLFIFYYFLEHAGVRFWIYTIWRADSVECMLPRAVMPLSLHFLTFMCVCDASVCAKKPQDISGVTKGQTQCYQTEKGSLILDAAAWTVISVKRRRQSCSPPFLPFSFSFCHSCWQSLIVLDKLMKSNTEETTGSPSCSLHLPKYMSVCAYLPVPMSGSLVSSGVPASQHDDETVREWWEARPYLRGEVRSADVK